MSIKLEEKNLTLDQALQLAIAHHRAGELQEAEKLYKAILEKDPNNSDANHNLGVLIAGIGKIDIAIPFFRKAVEINPKIEQYHKSLNEALRQVWLLDVSKDPQSLQKEIETLICLFNQGSYSEALPLAEKMTKEFPQFGFGWKVLGVILKMQNRIQDALVVMEKAIGLLPNDAEVYNHFGVVLKSIGRFPEAEVFYRNAIKLNPEYADAYNNLGNVLKDLGRLTDAEASCLRAIVLDPTYVEAYYNLGNILQDIGRLTDAEVAYRKTIELKPDFAEAYNNLGITLQGSGRFNDAEVAYRKTIELSPDFAEAYNNLGNVQKELDRLMDAEIFYRKAIELKPDFTEAYNNLGVILQGLKKYLDAETSYRKAIELNPDYAETHNNLGVVFQKEGRLFDAEISFRKAIQLKPNYADAHNNLGNILCYLDYLNEAMASYKESVRCFKPLTELNASVHLAILYYLSDNLKESYAWLESSNKIIDMSADKKYKNSANYWTYLTKLQFWQKNRQQESYQRQGIGKLYVVGESHSLTAHGLIVEYNNTEMICTAEWIAGCKQWHLGNAEPNMYKYKFEALMARLPRQSIILLTIGEIDCRYNEGILHVWGKLKDKSIEEIAYATIKAYLSYIIRITAHYKHQIIISGVPATNSIKSENLLEDTVKRVIEVVKIFNLILKRETLSAGMEFLDVYALTDRGDGTADGRFHIDSYHLTPLAMSEAFDKFICTNQP